MTTRVLFNVVTNPHNETEDQRLGELVTDSVPLPGEYIRFNGIEYKIDKNPRKWLVHLGKYSNDFEVSLRLHPMPTGTQND